MSKLHGMNFPLLAGLVVLVGTSTIQGILSDRWGSSGKVETALEGLSRVPLRFGEWEAKVDSRNADEAASYSRMGIKGYLDRTYTTRDNKLSVSFMIVCGKGGPICAHTPDVCYASAGFDQLAKKTRESIECSDGKVDEFLTSQFAKPNVLVPTQLQIFWGWSTDGAAWRAPENERLVLAHYPALYKLYVVAEVPPGADLEGVKTCRDFLQSALPTIRKTLPGTEK